MENSQVMYHTIVLPVRPQPDTIAAIFILKYFGRSLFPGIENTKYHFRPTLSANENTEELFKNGYILLDLGGGVFDHHNKEEKTTTSLLVAKYLEVDDDPALSKILEYTRRDDFYGKGTISEDPIDRAFGLSALITALNKSNPENPAKVIEAALPLIEAHYKEESKRYGEFPNEVEQKKLSGAVIEFQVKQRSKKLKVIMIESNSVGLPGFLRSQMGGKYDVVVQRTNSGHVNILTRPAKRIDLRSLIALIRIQEIGKLKSTPDQEIRTLMVPGRHKDVGCWYYDTATNSILNGGSSPSSEIKPTNITWPELRKIIELGLSESLISPLN